LARRGGPILLAGGRRLQSDARLEPNDKPRLVFLPSFQAPDPELLDKHIKDYDALHKWLRTQSARGIQIAASGAAVFHLAAAGLLDRATCAVSHRLVLAFARLWPKVPIDSERSICQAGNIWTCSRDADAAMLVNRLLGEAFSPSLSHSLAMREQPSISAEAAGLPPDQLVARAQLWIRDHFTQKFQVSELARHLGVSHQALIRRFGAVGSATPRAFVQQTKISTARSMLTETNRSITEIAQLVGYSDIPSFRRVFVEVVGMTPGAFRRERRRALKER
jgi:transcriptional regulator GlxA family with amidase domain